MRSNDLDTKLSRKVLFVSNPISFARLKRSEPDQFLKSCSDNRQALIAWFKRTVSR